MWEVSNLDTSSSGWLPLILMLFSWAGKPFPLGSSSWGFHVPVPLSGVVLGMEWIVFSVYSECAVSGFWGDGVWDGWRGCVAPLCLVLFWGVPSNLRGVATAPNSSGGVVFSEPLWEYKRLTVFLSNLECDFVVRSCCICLIGVASMSVCCLVWG